MIGPKESRIDCTHEGVTYTITCTTCKSTDVKAIYEGETGRSGYTRGKNHLDGWRRKEEDNPLTKHWASFHQEDPQEPEFTMKLKKKYIKPLPRQVAEAVAITLSEADLILNSKSEWNSQKVPRVTRTSKM